jgi:hypothetical protein
MSKTTLTIKNVYIIIKVRQKLGSFPVILLPLFYTLNAATPDEKRVACIHYPAAVKWASVHILKAHKSIKKLKKN